MKDIADLTGYNEKGEIVYQLKMSVHDYYDGEHPWDDTEEILKLGLTRINGKIYDSEGTLNQEFETSFSKDTGKYIGSKAVYDDGSINKDGNYQTQG